MAIEVKIRKKLETFELNIEFQSECKRIGILGASGSGKSMTLKCIAGIVKPEAGRIQAGEKVFYDAEQKIDIKPQKRRVGYLFQNYALFPTMTVEENIAAGLSGEKKKIAARVSEMVKRFHLSGLEKRLPSELSGGQQQRVALARIMAYEPEMILLDEPFAALDQHLREELQRELMELLKDYQGTVILVSHNQEEVYRMSDELLVLEEGKIICQDQTKRIFARPRHIAAARLTGCKNIGTAEEFGLSGIEGVVGIRPHQFQREGTESDLSFTVKSPMVVEDLFEYDVSFQLSETAKKRLHWKVSKKLWDGEIEPVPEILYLDPKELLLLQ